jgi:hypothetical protein
MFCSCFSGADAPDAVVCFSMCSSSFESFKKSVTNYELILAFSFAQSPPAAPADTRHSSGTTAYDAEREACR